MKIEPDNCGNYIVMQAPKIEKVIKMRDATPEERESIDKYIKSTSKPTGVDFWDLEQEPKTGRWVKKENDICWWYVCSECGQEPLKNKWNYDDVLSRYCPNCGAKMAESEETETWNGILAQITAPKGTFEKIFNDKEDDDI